MPTKTKPPSLTQNVSGDNNVVIGGDVNGVVIAGDNNTVNQTVVQRITNFFAGDTEQQHAQRNRRAMLDLMKNTWIKGVLERSLYKEVLIDLGLEERPGSVDHPWDLQVQMPNRANRALLPGTSMMKVFDEMNGAMLILGEPGSGKTTMLLELARDCISRAEQDDNRSIPVVFNLSSWDDKQSFDDWLIKELKTKYYVAQNLAQNWVSNGDLQLLLDGLDEVKQENREACTKAINDFRQKYGLAIPIAVCSRITDYEALTTKLTLSGAVLLQALTSEQINEYFEHAGSELEGVHRILEKDEVLQELVKQPLILSIMTLAYQGKPVDAIASEDLDTIKTRRKHLFDTYIQQMFERVARTKSELYTPEQTKGWLAWLAQKCIEHNVSLYLFENMQPEWLSQKRQKYYRLLAGLILGLLIGLIAGPFGGWIFGLRNGPSIGLLSGLFLVLVSVSSTLIAEILGKFFKSALTKIEMVDTVVWSWKQGGRSLLAVLFIGLIGALIGARLGEMKIGLIVGILFGMMGLSTNGLKVKQISHTTLPGQKIFLTIRTSLFVFSICLLLFGPLVGVTMGLTVKTIATRLDVPMDRLTEMWQYSLISGLIIGLLLALVIGTRFGIRSIIQHYTLRFTIASNKLFPWHIAPFLDYCVDRIFLRRVGGGYIFVHRLLMEHFAAMYPASEK